MSSISLCHVRACCFKFNCATLANSFFVLSVYISFSTNSLPWCSFNDIPRYFSSNTFQHNSPNVVILFVSNFGIAAQWLADAWAEWLTIMWAYWVLTIYMEFVPPNSIILRAWQNSESLVTRWPHAATAWERRLYTAESCVVSCRSDAIKLRQCGDRSALHSNRSISGPRPPIQSNIPPSPLWWSSARHGRYPGIHPPWMSAHSLTWQSEAYSWSDFDQWTGLMERVIVLAVIAESIGIEAVILYVEVKEKENGSLPACKTQH